MDIFGNFPVNSSPDGDPGMPSWSTAIDGLRLAMPLANLTGNKRVESRINLIIIII
jgi:hypothetical protein